MGRFLVTGCSGFIGSNLAVNLVRSGHEVVCVGRSNEQPTPLPCVSYTFHDLNWSEIGAVDGVFHQAAITNTLHPDDDEVYRVNFDFSKVLFQQAVEHGAVFIVYASSCAVYGDVPAPFKEDGPKQPLNPYGKSKLILDEWAMPWARSQGVRVIGLRYSNVYGPKESHKGKSASMVYQLAQQISAGKRPRLFEFGEQQRDFVHIDDVIQANRCAVVAPSGLYNVGSGCATSFNDIVKHLNEVRGTNLEPEYFPNPITSVYQNLTTCDLEWSRRCLGYRPKFNIGDGIRDYAKSGTLF